MSEPACHNAPPGWFNHEFLEKALKKGLKLNDSDIFETDIKMATAPGDHYASCLFRCNLTIRNQKTEGKTKNMSVIVKVIPSGFMGEELKKFCAFEREAQMLSTTLPAINKILKDVYPDEYNQAAECYYHENSPNNFIIMEDLKAQNYMMADRREGLDMDHAALVLKSLGKFHAATLLLKQKCPESLEMYKSQVWCRENAETMKQFFNAIILTLTEDILTWEDFDRREVFHLKLQELEKNIMDKILDVFEIDNSRMNVLMHGDSWVNNFMFRYDSSGKPVQMKFVDFQLSCINSPALELQYFIFSSTKENLKFTHIDTFLKIYYDSFIDATNRLNLKLPTDYDFQNFKNEFEKKFLWGLVILCCVFPLFKVPSNETVSLDQIMQGESKKFRYMFQRKDVRSALKKGLLFFEEKGII